jgi:hypothetical protein
MSPESKEARPIPERFNLEPKNQTYCETVEIFRIFEKIYLRRSYVNTHSPLEALFDNP